MSQSSNSTFPVPFDIQDGAHCKSMQQYKDMHKRSMDDPQGFWGNIAAEFHWNVRPKKYKFLEFNFDASTGPILTYKL